MLLDTHFHLNFLQDAATQQAFITELEKRDAAVVAQTVLPSEFEQRIDIPLSSVGYHPWYVSESACETQLEIFEKALSSTCFVGEVGLDFSPRGIASTPSEEQVAVFRRIVQFCNAQDEPVVMSIHSVRSAETVLDILEQDGGLGTEQKIIPVFHWFSDGGAALQRLLKLGGFLSINQKMLATKRGKAYARQVPGQKIVLESDMPVAPFGLTLAEAQQAAAEHAHYLAETLNQLSLLRGEDFLPQLLANQQKIYLNLLPD